MEALVHWFSQNLSQYISPEGAVFIKTLKICLINNRINGIGIIFPTIHSGIAFAADILSKDAASNPPLSSKSGIIEIIKTAPSGEIYCDRFCENQCTSASIKPPNSYFR